MTLSGLDIVTRSADFEERAAGCELRSWQWALLHALDDHSELRDLAMAHGLELDLALAFCGEAEAAGLVRVATMTLDQYRRSAGSLTLDPTTDDHFSPDEHLGAYERTVPAWMIEHHEEPVVAEPNEEPVVAAHHDDEPVVAEHHDEPVVAEPAVLAWSFDPPVPAEPEPEPEAEPVAVTDAASAVAGLVSLAAVHEEPTPEPEAEPVPEPAASSAATNGHAPAQSWEPMTLVTSVDTIEPVAPAEPVAAAESVMPDGISIHLGAQPDDHAFAEPLPYDATPAKGSISFSFAPGDAPAFDSAPAAQAAEPVAPAVPSSPVAPPPPAAPGFYSSRPAAPAAVPAPPALAMPVASEPNAPKNDLVGNLLAKALTFRIK